MARRDGYWVPVLPFVPGLEVSGRVRALGSGVTEFDVGQPVAAFMLGGGYAHVAVAEASGVHALPQDADLRAASTWLTVLPTAHAVLHEAGRLAAGESVLVHSAAGGVGTAIGQLARAAGAAAVLGVVSPAAKVSYALEHGYDRIFVGDEYAEAVPEATGGRGVDLILDAVGGETLRTNLGLLARFGRLVSFGNAGAQEAWQVGAANLNPRALGVIGFSYRALAREDPSLLRQITQNAVQEAIKSGIELPITGEFALDDVVEAHRRLESRATTGKLVVRAAGH